MRKEHSNKLLAVLQTFSEAYQHQPNACVHIPDFLLSTAQMPMKTGMTEKTKANEELQREHGTIPFLLVK